MRADCQPQRRPPLPPAAQPGPSGGISGLGFIITRPSPRPRRPPPGTRGASGGGWAVMRPCCAPGAGRGNSRKSPAWATQPRCAWQSQVPEPHCTVGPRTQAPALWLGGGDQGWHQRPREPLCQLPATGHPPERPRPTLGAGPPVGRPRGCQGPRGGHSGWGRASAPGASSLRVRERGRGRLPAARAARRAPAARARVWAVAWAPLRQRPPFCLLPLLATAVSFSGDPFLPRSALGLLLTH